MTIGRRVTKYAVICVILSVKPTWAQEQGAAREQASQSSSDQHEMAPADLGTLQIRGFNDVDYRAFQAGGAPSTFTIGQLDLFLSSRLTPQFNVLSEIVFEAGSDNAVGVDVERMLIQYSPNDLVSVSAGRFHTAIGYYNAAYHHGNWFQTAVGRPFIFRFEDDGGILPVHGVGITAQGQIPSGRAGLRYIVEISNGRASLSPAAEPVQNVADENRHKAVNLALVSRPASVQGLQFGVSAYLDRLTPDGLPSIAETIVAAHAVYATPAFEQLNEAIFIRHAPEGRPSATTTSFYTQIAPRIGAAHPYLRFEYLDVPGEEIYPVFTAVSGRSYGPSLGVRYDAAAAVAVKVQYDRFKGAIRPQMNGVTAQLAFTF